MALVGDRKWEEVAVTIANQLMKGEVRSFDLADKDAAWAWLKS